MQRESVARAVKLEPSIALFDAVPAVHADRSRSVQTVQRSGRVRTPIARRAAGRSPPHRPADSTLEPALPAACERVIRPLPLPVAHISQKGAESGHGRGNVEQNKNVGCFTFWFCGKVALCPGIAVHGASRIGRVGANAHPGEPLRIRRSRRLTLGLLTTPRRALVRRAVARARSHERASPRPCPAGPAAVLSLQSGSTT